MKKKVAEFASSTFDGGIETLIKDYMLMLDKDKFEPVFIVVRRISGAANDKILADNGIKIIPIYSYKHNSFHVKVIRKLNKWWYFPYRLKMILKQENIDVLHVHHLWLHKIKKISGFIKKWNIKLLYTCHSEASRFLGNVNPHENKAAKYLIKNNDLRIIALHDDMRKEINEMFGIDNTIVIRNGIDFKRFRNVSESKEHIRTLLNIPQNAFVMGHVGRFSYEDEKNHNFLTDVFIELCNRKDNAFLFMVGSGESLEQTEAKLDSLGLKDKYMILSHRTDIPRLLKAMDVFVFPSKYEGLGNALIEAEISGLRCIASDTIPDEAFQTETAIPVSLNKSPSEWCDVILDNSIKGTSCRNIEDYDMKKEIKHLERLYLGEQIN